MFKRWLLLILIAQLIGGGIGYAIGSREPQVYVAKAEIAFVVYGQNAGLIRQMKAKVNDIFALPEILLQETINHLDLAYTTDELRNIVTIFQTFDFGWFAIYVRHSDPQLAADIANQVADEMVSHFPTFRLNAIELVQYEILQALHELFSMELYKLDEEYFFVNSLLGITKSERVRDNLTTQWEVLLRKLMDVGTRSYDSLEGRCQITQTCGVVVNVYEKAQVPTVLMKPEAALQLGVFGAVIGLGFAISCIGIRLRCQN